MKLLMENWRQYVAEVEQEEEPLEEGLGSKILAGLALLAGTAAGSGQAHAGDGVINISPEKTQILVQAYDDMAAATDDRDPKKNKILRAKADLVKSADDGQITRDEVETWGPASQSIMMQVMQTLNEPSAPETPTASSASDAPVSQTTVTQRQEIRDAKGAAQQAAMNLYLGILQNKPDKKAEGLAALQMLQKDYGIEIGSEFQDLKNLTKDQAKALVTSLAN